MDEATTEEKFHTAVQLIKNLPKTGSFQPSNDLKLKFYSYYKQATEGPCDLPKPSFWDIVSRAKWDAWKGLGTMSKEDAMQHYINAFIEILQTTPYDDSVGQFVDMMGPFIEYAPKELTKSLEMNGSKGLDEDSDHSPIHASSEIVENIQMANAVVKQLKGKDIDGDSSDHSDQTPEDIQPCAGAINGHNLNGSNESDSEEFSDTFDKVNENDSDDQIDISCATVVEEISQNPVIYNTKGANVVHVRGGGDQRSGSRDSNSPVPSASGGRTNRLSRHGRGLDGSSQHPPNANISGGAGGSRRSGGHIVEPSVDVGEQLALAVIRLQHTMEQVVSRLDSLEVLLQERKSNPCIQVSKMKSSLWSVFGLSTRAALLILVWPFIAQWLIHVIRKRRQR